MKFTSEVKRGLLTILLGMIAFMGGVALLASVNETITERSELVKEQIRNGDATQTPPTQEEQLQQELNYSPTN